MTWNSTPTETEICEWDSPSADHLVPDDTSDPDQYYDAWVDSQLDLL